MSRLGRIRGWFPALLVLVWAGSFSLAEKTPDFSGNWTLNEEKSELPSFGRGGGGRGEGGRGGGFGRGRRGGGRGRGLISGQLSVSQQSDTLTVTQESRRGGSREITLKPGAGPQEISSFMGVATVEAKWKGSKLEVKQVQERETSRGSFKLEQKALWSLSDDGRTLTQKITLSTPRGDMDHTLVFEKE